MNNNLSTDKIWSQTYNRIAIFSHEAVYLTRIVLFCLLCFPSFLTQRYGWWRSVIFTGVHTLCVIASCRVGLYYVSDGIEASARPPIWSYFFIVTMAAGHCIAWLQRRHIIQRASASCTDTLHGIYTAVNLYTCSMMHLGLIRLLPAVIETDAYDEKPRVVYSMLAGVQQLKNVTFCTIFAINVIYNFVIFLAEIPQENLKRTRLNSPPHLSHVC